MLGLICQLRAQRIARPIRKPRNNADEAIAPKPEGTGLSGRSALSRRSPVGPATGVASLRASHPGKPPSRPRGACSEVPYRSHLLGACVGRSIFGLQVNPQGENTMRFLVSKG